MMSETVTGSIAPPPLGLRRALLDWRDYWIEETFHTFDREVKALWVDLEDIDAALSPIDRLFRNNSVEQCENHLAGWIEATQRRLPDAALADLAPLIAQVRSAARTEVDAEDISAQRLRLDTLPAAARLRAAAKSSGAKQRQFVTNALTGETGSLAAETEAWLCRTVARAIAAGAP